MKLVDNWRTWPHRWSVRLNIAGSAVLAILVAWPDAALNAWSLLPADLRAAIPPRFMPLISMGLFSLSAFAQLVKQRKLQPKEGDQ